MRLRQSGSDKDGKAATVSNIDDVLLRPIAKGQARAQLQLVSPMLQLPQQSQHCFLACSENAAGLCNLHSKMSECRCTAGSYTQLSDIALQHSYTTWRVSNCHSWASL